MKTILSPTASRKLLSAINQGGVCCISWLIWALGLFLPILRWLIWLASLRTYLCKIRNVSNFPVHSLNLELDWLMLCYGLSNWWANIGWALQSHFVYQTEPACLSYLHMVALFNKKWPGVPRHDLSVFSLRYIRSAGTVGALRRLGTKFGEKLILAPINLNKSFTHPQL